MPRVVHFEIPADDPQRALEFYTGVFNWKVDKWGTEDYWLVMTDGQGEPGINGAILKRSSAFNRVVNSIGVRSVDEYAERIEAHGGRIVQPKMQIGSAGWVAYFSDPEGNISGLFESRQQKAS